MAIKTQLIHVAVCDVCGVVFDENSDRWFWDETPELALEQVLHDPDLHWLLVGERQNVVVCPVSDTAHYLARGGESPALLKPGRDAMNVTH